MDEKEDKPAKPKNKPKSEEKPEQAPINPDDEVRDQVPFEESKGETIDL